MSKIIEMARPQLKTADIVGAKKCRFCELGFALTGYWLNGRRVHWLPLYDFGRGNWIECAK